jgi:WD40 repeat protein
MRWTSATVRAAVVLLACFAASLADAASFKRRALVIANTGYVHTAALKNPRNDAALINDKLQELGFEVQIERDLNARQFSEVMEEFAAKLDKESEALIYYAGHGLQFRGENFLVGIDARLKSQTQLQFETFKLNTIIAMIEQRALITLLFWDACRDNPLAEDLMRSVGPLPPSDSSQVVRGGAAPVAARPGDTFIVFSAEPGKKALDGSGELSPFAEALGRHISSPNVEIEAMLKRVTKDVLERTHYYQRPERLSQLTQEFYFRPANVAYEEEIKSLRAKQAMLQPEPGMRKQFTIVGSDDAALRRLVPPAPARPGPTSLTRGQEASPLSTQTTPTKGGVTSDVASADSAGSNVVVAGDRAASTVVRKLRISPDGKLLALGDEEGFVRVIRLDTFEVIASIPAHGGRISDLDFSPDSGILLSVGRDRLLRFWDVNTPSRSPVRELKAPESIPYSARINSNNPDRYVLMGDRDGHVIAWNLKRNQIITNTKFHQGPVHSVAYQPGGNGTYLSGGADGQLKIRLPGGQRLSLHPHNGVMFQASYSGSGKLVYTVGADRTARIWDAADPRRQLAVMSGHLKYVLTADMSPDEKLLVTGGGDKVLNLWDVASGALRGQMKGHTSDIEAVAFSPNGKFVVSASEDKSVIIWSVENQEALATLFFQKNGDKYAGVTFDNQAFGERNSGLLSVYVDGRQVSGPEAERVVRYIGRGIAIIENEN